jgi:adenylate cyclase
VFTLSYREPDGVLRRHALPPGDTIVGRAATCDVVINHPSVSRTHLKVTVRGDACMLTDLGSARGTRRQNQLIAGPVEVINGETIRIGQVEIAFVREAEPQGVSISEDRQIVDPSATLYRRVDSLVADRAAAAPMEAARLLKLLSDISTTLVAVQPLPQILERVVDLVFEVVAADRAYLLLRDAPDRPLSARVMRRRDGRVPEHATVSRTVVDMVMRDRVALLAFDALSDRRLDQAGSLHTLNIRSFMCAPLWNRNDVIGVLYADNPQTRKFGEDDLTVFSALSNYAAVAIDQAQLGERLREETRRRDRLEQYHSPAVVKRILNTESIDVAGLVAHERDVSVMFCDIVGFTSITEAIEPRAVADLLNEFFEAMTDEIFERQGTLDKFIGDAILAVFGAPFEQADHAVNAVDAALGMRRALATLNERRQDRPLQMRIAIHSGPVLTGDIGSPKRREFTVLGDTVNITSRLQTTVARAGQIVVSRETYERLGGRFKATPLGAVSLRGRRDAIDAFQID